MRVKGEFRFYNVGQGLFYTGRVYPIDKKDKRITFVYDIGGDPKYIKRAVEIFKKDASYKVNLLVLSHLHWDHINGLYQLFNGKRPQKWIKWCCPICILTRDLSWPWKF